jgi:hypothetical protein
MPLHAICQGAAAMCIVGGRTALGALTPIPLSHAQHLCRSQTHIQNVIMLSMIFVTFNMILSVYKQDIDVIFFVTTQADRMTGRGGMQLGGATRPKSQNC